MKIKLLIPPVLALVLAGAWNLAQMRSISSLEKDRASLLNGIAAVPGSSNGVITNTHRPSKSTRPSSGKVNWNFISTTYFAEEGSVGGMRELLEFKRRLANMTPLEMADALDEIASQDMSAYGRRRLEWEIMEKLIEQEPGLALTRFTNHLGERYGIGMALPDAFSNWAKTDPAAATAWFDKQIADGKFDRKSLDDLHDMRRVFEGKLMTRLLETDPALAAQRISSLPDDQRAGVLKSIQIRDPSREFSTAYGNFVRTLPADQQEECFAYVGHYLRPDLSDSFSEVNRFLEHTQATPAERTATVVAAGAERLKQFPNSPEFAIGKMKEYFQVHSPEQADSLVGQALAESTQRLSGIPFADAAQVAQQYHETSGNDDALVAFLERSSTNSDAKNLARMIELAGKIQDDAQRSRILAGLESKKNQP